MAEIVNLRRARKRKARTDAETAAEVNRLKHGVSKRERDRAEAEAERLRRDIDSKKLDLSE